jgi:hypothetical protein
MSNHAKKAPPRKESILELAKFMDAVVRVKCLGGRELQGTLRGYDEVSIFLMAYVSVYLSNWTVDTLTRLWLYDSFFLFCLFVCLFPEACKPCPRRLWRIPERLVLFRINGSCLSSAAMHAVSLALICSHRRFHSQTYYRSGRFWKSYRQHETIRIGRYTRHTGLDGIVSRRSRRNRKSFPCCRGGIRRLLGGTGLGYGRGSARPSFVANCKFCM